MRRRTVLATTGAILSAISGCFGMDDSGATDEDFYNGTQTPRISRGAYASAVHGRREYDSLPDAPEVSCARVTKDAVWSHLEGQLPSMDGISVGAGNGHPERNGITVTVGYVTKYDRSGEIFQKPAVSFEQLVSVTPRTASATLVSPDETYDCEFPIDVIEREMQLE